MALIGVQTNGLSERYSIEGAYRLLREAGFDAADVGLNSLLPYREIVEKRKSPLFGGSLEESLRHFLPYKEAAEKYGILNAQAHAPYPSWVDGPDGAEYNDYLITVLNTTLAGSALIGCKKLVIHPFFHPYETAVSPREEWELNRERYTRLIPAAQRYGVTILLENMFTRCKGKIYEGCCSDFDRACQYVDELNRIAGAKTFAFCLDTGHALLLGKDLFRAMTTLGSRIEAFHIHDNNGTEDQHLAPYMGIADWDRFVSGLKAIQYQGHLSFETYRTLTRAFDPDLTPEVLRLIARTGRLFAERAGI